MRLSLLAYGFKRGLKEKTAMDQYALYIGIAVGVLAALTFLAQ